MDEEKIPSDETKEPDALPIHSMLPPASALNHKAKPHKRTFAIVLSFVAVIFASIAWLMIQRFITQTHRTLADNTTAQQKHSEELGQIQSMLTDALQSNERLSTQIKSTEHQVQLLIQEQGYKTPDWKIQKARYFLELAQISSDWTDDLNTTATLLKHADSLLADIQNPELETVHEAIAKDLITLQQIPIINTNSILLKLNDIQNQITLLCDKRIDNNPAATKPSSTNTATWRTNLQEAINQLQQLVIIQHHDELSIAKLMPNQTALLKESLRLNIQQAELAVIQHQQMLFTQSLEAALNTTIRGFDQHSDKTQSLILAIKSLLNTNVVQEKPTLNNLDHLLDTILSTTPSNMLLNSKETTS